MGAVAKAPMRAGVEYFIRSFNSGKPEFGIDGHNCVGVGVTFTIATKNSFGCIVMFRKLV
jgi:hypothetical protein